MHESQFFFDPCAKTLRIAHRHCRTTAAATTTAATRPPSHSPCIHCISCKCVEGRRLRVTGVVPARVEGDGLRACVAAYCRSGAYRSQLVAAVRAVRRAMTDFTARQSQQPAQQPQRLQMPVTAARPPYFDFNDIFGSAGKKPSPPVTCTATTAATTSATTTGGGGGGPGTGSVTPTIAINLHHNNNNSNNNNNNNNNVKQPSAAGGQQQQSATATGCCPVCGTALRTAHELESHFVWELERLYKQAAAAGRRHRRGTPDKLGDHHHNQLMVCARDGGGQLSPVAGGSRDGSLHGRWEVMYFIHFINIIILFSPTPFRPVRLMLNYNFSFLKLNVKIIQK